jgi:hypothetical protein
VQGTISGSEGSLDVDEISFLTKPFADFAMSPDLDIDGEEDDDDDLDVSPPSVRLASKPNYYKALVLYKKVADFPVKAATFGLGESDWMKEFAALAK